MPHPKPTAPFEDRRDGSAASDEPRDWAAELVRLMQTLRSPHGCPWDREQTHATLKRYLVEETAELLDAIDDADDERMKDELGDVLLQVVFHSQIAAEQGRFNFQDVARACCEKLVRRHPHVFGDREARTAAEVLKVWKDVKWQEQKQRENTSASKPDASVLDGVPRHLPALHRAYALQKKAARVGFDWPDIAGVLAKIHEEFAEVREALDAGDRTAACREIGDLLFAVVNLSRFIECEPEDSLRQAIRRFQQRFAWMEARLKEQGRRPDQCTLEELDDLWNQSKSAGM